MPAKAFNDRYQLMVTRSQGKFGWKIRHDHRPSPLLIGEGLFHTGAEAAAAGEIVLVDLISGRDGASAGPHGSKHAE